MFNINIGSITLQLFKKPTETILALVLISIIIAVSVKNTIESNNKNNILIN